MLNRCFVINYFVIRLRKFTSMSIHDTYSKRNKSTPDVFSYDELTEKLKNQIVHIWNNYFDQLSTELRIEFWEYIHKILCEEFGKKSLLEDYLERYYDSYRVAFYFEKKATLEECLDIVEIIFRAIAKVKDIFLSRYYSEPRFNYSAEQAIKDLNTRFLENAVGFSFEQGKIIRVDNSLLHREVIIPVFSFLNSNTFRNANDEFLSAHEHFRHNRYKECLADCLKAFETTMKIICDQNAWAYKQNDTAKALIDICFKNNLVPNYLQTEFSSFRAQLESGIPTLRNKLGGHGQGTQQIKVPKHFASYMLYLTGTTIYFLISCQKEIRNFN